MPLIVIFLMGVANFALHGAVLGSRHPLFEQVRWFGHGRGQGIALAIEFLVLTAALGFAYRENGTVLWFYGVYTAINAVSAWLVVSKRI